MLNYELAQILHTLQPYLITICCIIVGILIDRTYWKPRIYRYANREIVKTLEYQKNKIEALEQDIREKNSIISDLRGYIKMAKISALKIVEVIK